MPQRTNRFRGPKNCTRSSRRRKKLNRRRTFKAELLEDRRLLAYSDAFSVLDITASTGTLDNPSFFRGDLSNLAVLGRSTNYELWSGNFRDPTLDRVTNAASRLSPPMEIFGENVVAYSIVNFPQKRLVSIEPTGAITELAPVEPRAILVPDEGSDFYFFGNDGSGTELWVSGGTPGSTEQIEDLLRGPLSGAGIPAGAFLGDRLLFAGRDTVANHTLWSTDSTGRGVEQISNRVLPDFDQGTAIHAESLYFYGRPPNGGTEEGVWRTDGTDAGTRFVAEAGNFSKMVKSGDYLYVIVDAESGSQIVRIADPDDPPEPFYEFIDEAGVDFTTDLVAFKGGVAFWEADPAWDVSGGRVLYLPEDMSGPIVLDQPGSGQNAISAKSGYLTWISERNQQTTIKYSDGTIGGTHVLDFEPDARSLTPQGSLGRGRRSAYTDETGRMYFGFDSGQGSNKIWTIVANPQANAGPDEVVSEGDVLVLDGSASFDSESAVISYEWDFDYDGTNFDVDATGVQVSFDATDGPVATQAALRLTDIWGQESIDTVSVTVNNIAPFISGLGDTSTTLGSPITITADISDPGDDTLSIEWDLGDGSPVINDVTSVTETYAAEGEYFASLTVTDSDGAVTVKDFRVVVGPPVTLTTSAHVDSRRRILRPDGYNGCSLIGAYRDSIDLLRHSRRGGRH